MTAPVITHADELAAGQRFEFGANWARFLEVLNDERIARAENSLREMLGVQDLHGRRMLDIGSGSGLFSLAARRLGATVHSFDYDPQSVACTRELKRRFFADDPAWTVEPGSVLDEAFLSRLGQWDIVYSWGVLHHTGSMWKAIANAAERVAPGGTLFIAIYNDQGLGSKRWLRVKQLYNRLPKSMRWLVLGPALVRLWGLTELRDTLSGRPGYHWRNYAAVSMRGMSAWRDVVDWVGGLPFEVAKPEEIFDFHRDRGFTMLRMRTCAGGLGCNEFVFRRDARA